MLTNSSTPATRPAATTNHILPYSPSPSALAAVLLRVLLFFLLLPLTARAQQPSGMESDKRQAEKLFARFKAAAGFDHRYPREKVYLHFDNSSYLEGDTLWYKAYVVRASTLKPTDLSRVLYVELLNADGQQMEQQLLPIDSLGQADGCFILKLPLRAGYYEVRAFTREMTNWGEEACFSRVLPVFGVRAEEKGNKGDRTAEDLYLPLPAKNKKVTLGCPRPYTMDERRAYALSFYPEGGSLARGLEQRVAYKLTDGRGTPLAETLQIADGLGNIVGETTPEHEGMGTFTLPEGHAGDYSLHMKDGNAAFPLPTPSAAYTMTADMSTDADEPGLYVRVAGTDSATANPQLLALALLSRERATYFDTLTVGREGVELLIPQKALHAGVNRLELFDRMGRNLCTRLVWEMPQTARDARAADVSLKQNKSVYGAFEPAVLDIRLTDGAGLPLQSVFSLAVHDKAGGITADGDGGIGADMLLSSELRGYIHRPDLYFARDDAAHRRMLDLLMMVQGWTANRFDVMCGTDSFLLRQPIEDKLILRGYVYKDNDKRQPMPDTQINLAMYAKDGQRATGTVSTDSTGYFAFTSNINYKGQLIAQFTMRENGKKRWSRLALDRWFAPQPRPLLATDLTLNFPTDAEWQATDEPETFEWRDTIPRTLPSVLGEAEVTARTKYRGFTGTRYTWNGGEKKGMREATKFYNIQQEVEHYKDLGYQPGTIWDFLSVLDGSVNFDQEHDATLDYHDSDVGRQVGMTSGGTESGSESEETGNTGIYLGKNSQELRIVYNNRVLSGDTPAGTPAPLNDFSDFITNSPAEEISSVALVDDGLAEDAVTGKTVNNSRARYSLYIYEIPDDYRYRSQKGIERRRVQGFTSHMAFYSPNYRSFDLPTAADRRRTLLWAPSVKTDKEGHASVIFFTNSHESQRLGITARGISPNGLAIDYTR